MFPALIDIPTERTTAGTDLLLALTALAGMRFVGRARDAWAGLWRWTLGLMAFASVAGAVAHGFVLAPALKALIWVPLYLSLGLVVGLIVASAIGARWGESVLGRSLKPCVGVSLAFFLVAITFPESFLVFVAFQSVGLAAAIALFGACARRSPRVGYEAIVTGLCLSLMAGAVQASRVRIEMIWTFDNNGLYHLVQIVGIILVIVGVRASSATAKP